MERQGDDRPTRIEGLRRRRRADAVVREARSIVPEALALVEATDPRGEASVVVTDRFTLPR